MIGTRDAIPDQGEEIRFNELTLVPVEFHACVAVGQPSQARTTCFYRFPI